MHVHSLRRLPVALIAISFISISLAPVPALAATTKRPTCALTVTTEEGKAKVTDEGEILVSKGEPFQVAWTSKDAKSAKLDGSTVKSSGSKKYTPTKTTTYEFTFTNGSKKAECEVTAVVASGSIDKVSTGAKPTISGKVTGVKKVDVALFKKGSKKPAFEKKGIKVKNGKWEAKVSKALTKGEYEVRLTGGKDYELDAIATATLTAGTKNTLVKPKPAAVSKGILSVSTIPLLGGGSTSPNATVPVAYLQVQNPGTQAVRVTGFELKQNGTAPGSTIASLSTVDDQGGSRGVTTGAIFQNGLAIAPTDATILPGAMKLFTIKATLGANAVVGTNLMLDVTGVETDGTKRGAFPIRGTMWTIGY